MGRSDDSHSASCQVGGEPRKAIVPTVRPAEVDHHITAFDITGLSQAATKRSQNLVISPGDLALRNPITGSVACARAPRPATAAAPPIIVMNSRRFMPNTAAPPTGTAADHTS
jgi:hypothetical protein